MTTAPGHGKGDCKKRDVAWRRCLQGWQLHDGLSWIAFAGQSHISPGRFYWKLYSGDTSYCGSLLEAKDAAQSAALKWDDNGTRYVIADTVPNTIGMLAQALGAKP